MCRQIISEGALIGGVRHLSTYAVRHGPCFLPRPRLETLEGTTFARFVVTWHQTLISLHSPFLATDFNIPNSGTFQNIQTRLVSK